MKKRLTIMVLGLTVKALTRRLGLGNSEKGEWEVGRARWIALASARSELDDVLARGLVSQAIYDRVRNELDAQLDVIDAQIAAVYGNDVSGVSEEARSVRLRVAEAGKSAVETALRSGALSARSAANVLQSFDEQLFRLRHANVNERGDREL